MEASDKSITRRRPASEDVLIVDDEQDEGVHSFDGVVVQHGAYVGPQSPAPNQESHLRSVVKGLTWRVLATTTTTIREIGSALQIGLMEFVAKLGLYYLHERAWIHVRL